MDFLAEGFRRAFALLFSGDAEVYGIALLTLKIGIVSTVGACGLGLPVGFVLATRPFWGRRAALTVVNTALAFPTVVLGLVLYGLLSRRGPLGGLGWLYTWQAIALGDVLLAFPIAAALAAAAVQGVDPRDRLPGIQPSEAPERAAARQKTVQHESEHDGRERERGVHNGEGGATPPERPGREDEPHRQAEAAGPDGRNDPDLEREQGDAVDLGVTRKQQRERAPESFRWKVHPTPIVPHGCAVHSLSAAPLGRTLVPSMLFGTL